MKRTASGELCTIPEAARRSGLGLRQLRRAIQSEEVSVYQIGGWPRLRWSDVLAWVESRRRPTREGGFNRPHAREEAP